jgi:Dynamin central region
VNGLFKSFKEAVLQTKPPQSDEFVAVIKAEMEAFTGEELPGFMNFSYFENKLAAIIRDWGVLCQHLLEDAQEAVSVVIELLLQQQLLQRFPLLRQALQEAAQEVSALLLLHHLINNSYTKLNVLAYVPYDSFSIACCKCCNSAGYCALPLLVTNLQSDCCCVCAGAHCSHYRSV